MLVLNIKVPIEFYPILYAHFYNPTRGAPENLIYKNLGEVVVLGFRLIECPINVWDLGLNLTSSRVTFLLTFSYNSPILDIEFDILFSSSM